MEVWAWKSMIGLPKTTPTAAVIFSTGALFASIRIEMKHDLPPQSTFKRGRALDKNHCTTLKNIMLDGLVKSMKYLWRPLFY